jgi:hypothetical protein
MSACNQIFLVVAAGTPGGRVHRSARAESAEVPRSASMRARVAFLTPDNRFVLVCEIGEFSPALGHCCENRSSLKRDISSLCARRAI